MPRGRKRRSRGSTGVKLKATYIRNNVVIKAGVKHACCTESRDGHIKEVDIIKGAVVGASIGKFHHVGKPSTREEGEDEHEVEEPVTGLIFGKVTLMHSEAPDFGGVRNTIAHERVEAQRLDASLEEDFDH